MVQAFPFFTKGKYYYHSHFMFRHYTVKKSLFVKVGQWLKFLLNCYISVNLFTFRLFNRNSLVFENLYFPSRFHFCKLGQSEFDWD